MDYKRVVARLLSRLIIRSGVGNGGGCRALLADRVSGVVLLQRPLQAV